MYTNSAYLNNSRVDFKDKTRPLVVGSCGTYRLYTQPKLPTYRPRGRLDYQLLYIAAGRAHFHFDGKEEIVTAGHMVLYRPKEVQRYEYYGEELTEVYWVHFTGSDVKNILRRYGISDSTRIFYVGSALEFVPYDDTGAANVQGGLSGAVIHDAPPYVYLNTQAA